MGNEGREGSGYDYQRAMGGSHVAMEMFYILTGSNILVVILYYNSARNCHRGKLG